MQEGMEMNKKSMAAFFAAAVLCTGLTGCGKNAIPDMTDEQIQAIGEYVAVTMMKYDANHRSRLVDSALSDKKQYEDPSGPEATKEPSGMGAVDDTPVTDVTEPAVPENPYTMEEVLALQDGVTLVYNGQKICDAYPDTGESGIFSLNAAKGKKLLVLSFMINNTTEQEQEIDLLSSGATFRVTVNDTYSRSALRAGVILEDLSTYMGTIPAKSSAEAVILVEVKEEMASEIGSILLNVKNDTKTFTAKLL